MMTFVQLGWIQDIIDWVFDKILNPVFKWLSNLLSDVFGWLFNTILGPILEKVFTTVAETVGELFMRIFGRFLYYIEKMLLAILDMMQDMFDVLAGTQQVTDKAQGTTGSLMSVLVRSPFVWKTMMIVTMISVVLVFFFAVIATIRSIGDMGGPKSQSVGQVLRNLAYALLRMIAAPLFGLFLIVLGDAVLVSITRAMTMSDSTTLARSIFTISTLDAVEDKYEAVDKYGNKYKYSSSNKKNNPVLGYNYSTRPEWLAKHPGDASDYGLKDKFREPFYTGKKDYLDTAAVEKTFNFGRIDFIVGIGGTLLFIYIVGSALFVFTSRLFDLIVLLIIEPFFLAPMPLDDGEHFKKWEDMFIAKLFSGYGMVVAMYLYLLIAAMVFEGRISFTPRAGAGDMMMDMLMRMLLLYGGAATMMTAGPLVTSILNSAAAGQETQAMQAGQAFTAVAMKPLNFATKKAVIGGAKFFTGGKRGLVSQAEKAYKFTKHKAMKAIQGPEADKKKKGKGGAGGGGPQMPPGGYGVPVQQPMYQGQPMYQQPMYQQPMYQQQPMQGPGGYPGGQQPGMQPMPDMGSAFTAPGQGDGSQAFDGARPENNTQQSSTPTQDTDSGQSMDDMIGEGGGDDFDTVFDVGGKSLFDEGTASPSAEGGSGSGGGSKYGLGSAFNLKAKPETVRQTMIRHGIDPNRAMSSSQSDSLNGSLDTDRSSNAGDMSMNDIVGGGDDPFKEEDIDLGSLFDDDGGDGGKF